MQNKIENQNSPMFIKEAEFVIKGLSQVMVEGF